MELMVRSLITSGLLFILGYAYPVWRCFKIVKTNVLDMEQAFFWFQYWILLNVLAAFERTAHELIARIPMFSEAKLALLICLWFHKTEGANYVYESFKHYLSKLVKTIDGFTLKLKTSARCYLQYSGSLSTPLMQVQEQGNGHCSSLVAGASSREIQENATKQAALDLAVNRKAKQTLKGRRRTIWLILAGCSLHVALCILIGPATFTFKDWLIREIQKIVPGDDWVRLPIGIFLVVGMVYAMFLTYLGYGHKIPPIQLPSYVRWAFDFLFVLVSLALICWVESFWGMVYGFAICFHFIPLINLLGVFENFSFLDCSLVLLFEVGLCISRDPKYASYVEVSMLAVILVMKRLHIHSEAKRREEHPVGKSE